MKDKVITIVILFLGLSIHAQSYKPLKPLKGEIVFREISQITDSKSFNETLTISKQKFKESLKKSLLKDEEYNGKEKEIEIIASQNAEMMGTMMFGQDSTQTYTHQFYDFKIISTNSVNEEILDRYDIINQNKNISTTFSKSDSTTAYEEKPYTYSNNTILKIIENKRNQKKINGYDCYQVTYEYKEISQQEDTDYLEYAGDIIMKREMWVTDKIKSLYHPVIYDKEILEKYYPLDILETQSDVKGFKRRYILQKITLE